MIVKLFYFYYMTISFSNNSQKHLCTRCLKHFKEQRTLQQHRLYYKNEVEPENLIDQLRVTGGFSKHIRNSTIEKTRRYLKRLDADNGSKSN